MEVLNIIAVITDINNICRICLYEKMQSELCFLYENSLDIMIENLIDIKPLPVDGLPNCICKRCADKLTNAINFKEQCRQSEERLREILLKPHNDNVTLKEAHTTNESNQLSIIKSEKTPLRRRRRKKTGGKNWSTPCESSEDELFIDETESKDEDWSDRKQTKDIQKENSIKESKFVCKKCKKTFRSATGFRIHLIKHGKELKCEVCGKKFRLIKQLNEHTKLHKDYKPHICKICSKGFSAAGNLSKHMRVHGGEKRHLCTICGRRFFEPGHLQVHMRTHTGEKPIICNVCGKRFSDPHGLVAHNKIHTGERKYECKTCGKRFAHSFVLTAHNRIHTGERPYRCAICGASYATSSYLTIHKRTHTQEKPFNCESCPKAFVSRCALVAHNMTHTGEKRFECQVCGKRVARAADLNIHLRSHTGERPYGCDQCPKRYHTSSNLSAHKRTHLGIKNHICSICGKAFGDARTLKGHIRIHTGEKPYVCHICFNRYSQSGQLAAHRKTHACQIEKSNKSYESDVVKEERTNNFKDEQNTASSVTQLIPLLNPEPNDDLKFQGNYNDQLLPFEETESSNYQNQLISNVTLKRSETELDMQIKSQHLILLSATNNQNELIQLTAESSVVGEDVNKEASTFVS